MKRFLIFVALLYGFTLLGCTPNKEQSDAIDGRFVRITEKLSSHTVNDIIEDKLGYIWVATDRGLNKYNGYDYHNYFHTSNPHSLADNQVKTLLCDSRGIIWVGTVLGLCHYTKEDRFEQVTLMDPLSPYIQAIHETAEGRIVVQTNTQLEIYDWDQRKRTIVPRSSHKLETPFCRTFSDKQGRVWIIYPDRIEWHDFDKGTTSSATSLNSVVSQAYMHPNGILYMNMWDGTKMLYNTLTEEFLPTPKSFARLDGGIKAMMEYMGNRILIYTDDLRCIIFDPLSGECTPLERVEPTVKIPSGVLSTSLLDSKGNLWYGTYDQGLAVQYATAKQFNSNNTLLQTFANKSVTGMAEDSKGNIYISTYNGGLWRWNIGSDTISPLTVANKPAQMRPERIFIDSHDNIYINYPFVIAKHATGESNTLTFNNLYLIPSGMGYDLMEDASGRIWAGTNSGLLYILGNNPGETTEVHIEAEHITTSMLSPEVATLADGRIVTISLGTGITLINPTTLQQTNIPTTNVLDDMFIPTALRVRSNGEVWIGTRGQGLLVFNPKDESVRLKEGIHCKEIMEIVEVESGDLWISTMEGLTHWDHTSDKFHNYFASNGTGGDQYNESVGLLTSQGALMFGGTHGITYFNPRSVSNQRTANLYIEDLYINNTLQNAYNSEALGEHITEVERIELRQGKDASVGFTYAAVEYSEYPMILYSYRMEGFEDEWIDARDSRRAFYSNLPAGKYRFAVRAWNNDYSQLVGEDSVAVIVRAHPLLSPVMKWGVYPILVFLALSATYQLIRRSKRQKEEMAKAIREKEQEHKVNDMNMSFFVNISHEMRTPLTMIKGPLELLAADEGLGEDNLKLLGMTTRNVNRLLRFIDQLMDMSKIDNNSMSLEVGYTDVVEVVNQISEVFEVNAADKGITLTKRGLGDSYITMANEDKIEKIISNLLSNAIKFTPTGGHIELEFDVISHSAATKLFPQAASVEITEWAKFSVSDTGVGVPADRLEKIFERYYQVRTEGDIVKNYGTGIGLFYSSCLVALHHGFIKAENRTDTRGTRFMFIIPTSDAAYKDDQHRYGIENRTKSVASPIVEPSPTSMTTDSEHRQTLLIVEDDTEMMRFVKTLFEKEYNIAVAYDADSATALLTEQLPDIIVSDVVMPGKMDGYALCRRIKEDLNTCHIPVVLLTAKTNVEAQVEGLDAGADAYVMKPFEPSYLLALVGSLLTNRDRLRGLLGTVTHTENIENEKMSPCDKEFLDSLYELMEKELSNTELNITRMTEVLKIGRTRFYYKVKGLTGENPNVFFKTYKLNRAAELLTEEQYNISEVADMTGFSTLSHFSTSFKKQFGCSPSEYIASRKNETTEKR